MLSWGLCVSADYVTIKAVHHFTGSCVCNQVSVKLTVSSDARQRVVGDGDKCHIWVSRL